MKITSGFMYLNVALVSIAIVLATLFSLARIRSEALRQAAITQESRMQTFRELLRAKGQEFRIVDGKLLAGDYVINGNYELPDRIKEIFGGTATIFMGDMRVSTNVLTNDGLRAVGTRLQGPAYDAVFKSGQPFRGEAHILGIPYFTAYEPIKNKRGEVIGALYVGIKKSDFFSTYNRLRIKETLMAAVLIAIFTMLAFIIVSERKKAEAALRESRNLLNAVIEGTSDPVYVKDRNGCYLLFNSAASRLTGKSAADVLGRSDTFLFPVAETKFLIERDLGIMTAGKTMTFEEGLTTASGELKTYLSLKGPIFDEQGKPAGLFGIARDITGLKKTEEALRRSNQRLDLLSETAGRLLRSDSPQDVVDSLCRKVLAYLECDIFFNYLVDDDKQLLHLNACAGIPEGDLLRMEWLDYGERLCGRSAREGFRLTGEDFEEIRRQYPALIEPFGIQAHVCHPLIARGHLLGTLSFCSRDRSCFTEDDLSLTRMVADHVAIALERKQSEEALRELSCRLKLATTSGRLGIWDWYIPADILIWDECMFELYGITGDSFLGCAATFQKTLHPEDRPGVNTAIKAAILGEKDMDVKFRVVHPDGAVRTISANGLVLRDAEGRAVRMIGLSRDITEYEFMQNELVKTQKLESLGVLAGGIAHDFNNIITAILGYITIARISLDQGDKAHQMLEKAEESSHRAAGLARQLLTFAKGGDPVKKKISPKALVHESASLALRGSVVLATIDVPDDIHGVEADEGQVCQAFGNIITNAAQAMPEGGGLAIRGRNVTLEAGNKAGLPPGAYIEIAFTDEGHGISPEDLKNVFDPYFTTKADGTGLGLTTAYSIVSKHGGHIDVWSETGGGTTVTVCLPSMGEAFREQWNDLVTPPSRESTCGAILVMDDEEMIRNLTAEMMEYLGYEVTTCCDGAEAVRLYKAARASGRPFSAVLMDLTVPGGMGGREAEKLIHAFDPDARLIVSSGYSNDPVLADFENYGFCAAVTKPYRPAEIEKALSSV